MGQIFRSTDGATSWVDISPVDDPPNTWGDGTPPTVAALTFLQRVDNIHTNSQHIFIARQTGANRGWFLKTTDDGVTWEWQALLSVAYDGTYFYPTRVFPGCTTGFGIAWRYTDEGNMIGATDGLTGYWNKAAGNCTGQNSTGSMGAIFDFGIAVDSWQLETRTRGDMTSNTASGVRVSNDAACYGDFSCANWSGDGGLADNWYQADPTLTWNSLGSATGGPYQYLRLLNSATPGDSNGVQLHLDTVRIQGTASFNEVIPIWMDTDTQDGTLFFTTMWDGTDIVLQKRKTSDLSLQASVTLGATTEVELNAFTYIAYPFTPAFNNSVIFVYGRMNDPQSLGSPSHLIWSQDGGSTWALLAGGFGADHIGAFSAWDAGGGNWRCVFVVNDSASNVSEFWSGTTGSGFRKLADLPFRVNQDALTINGQSVAVGARAVGTGGEMVYVSNDLGVTWADATGSLNTDGELKSLVYV